MIQLGILIPSFKEQMNEGCVRRNCMIKTQILLDCKKASPVTTWEASLAIIPYYPYHTCERPCWIYASQKNDRKFVASFFCTTLISDSLNHICKDLVGFMLTTNNDWKSNISFFCTRKAFQIAWMVYTLQLIALNKRQSSVVLLLWSMA